MSRRFAVLCLAGCLAAFTSQAAATSEKVRGPWLLVSLPALGTVTWRCDPSRHPGVAPGLPALALGFHAFRVGQSGEIRLHLGGRTILRRVIQPGRSITLPYLRARVQQLDISESGEDGTLRAFVTVYFAAGATSGYCWPYLPPKIDVEVVPRR